MENNEQLNQNPQTTEGIENEQTTSKDVKKAIDGNEKKKIVKLIQPSILPGKVRIEVKTLVDAPDAEATPATTEAQVVPQDETLPEMEAVADIDMEEDEDDLVEDIAELDALSKLQLVVLLEEIVKETDIQAIKDKVAAIRLHFNAF